MILSTRGTSTRSTWLVSFLPAVASIAVLSSPVAAQTASDSTFLDANWTGTQFTAGNGGTSTGAQVLVGGNPGSFRNVTDVLNAAPGGGSTIVLSTHIFTPFTYTPATSGAIASLNYSEDAACTAGCFGQGQSTGPAIKQGANLYIYTTQLVTGPSAVWTNHALSGLTAADFGLVNVTSAGTLFDTTQHPNFSAAGAPIQVGFFRANGTPSGPYTLSAGIDNWQVTIVPSIVAPPPAQSLPVPTLGGWALAVLAISLAVAGFARRRRTR